MNPLRRAHLVPTRALGDKEAKALIKKFADLLPGLKEWLGVGNTSPFSSLPILMSGASPLSSKQEFSL
jgi:hypothetical protein